MSNFYLTFLESYSSPKYTHPDLLRTIIVLLKLEILPRRYIDVCWILHLMMFLNFNKHKSCQSKWRN